MKPLVRPNAAEPVTAGNLVSRTWDRFFFDLARLLNQTTADPVTVEDLPAADQSAGLRMVVTDATTTTFGSVVAGGGSNPVPVYCDGTEWRIG